MGPVDDPEFPNVYPSESKVPGFKAWMEQYFKRSQQLSLQLMEALEIALNLPKNALVDRCEGHASEIRMIYYPETNMKELEDGKSKRIWPHTDFGILTLLAQGSTGGLQIEDKNTPGGLRICASGRQDRAAHQRRRHARAMEQRKDPGWLASSRCLGR
jgi:isopenicillin N synthase-like dioxygenase